MAQIHSYLTFNGNCREAMHFYKDCLGGELKIQGIGETPMAVKMPAKMRDGVLHATLEKGNVILMGSDMVPDTGFQTGNSVSLILMCSSEIEIRQYYENLANGGLATHPLEYTFWGALFGGLTDKFGNHWLLNYEKSKSKLI